MYATVRRYEGVQNPAAAAKQVDEKFVPLISALPGFVEYYWIDLGEGAMISVTICKTLSKPSMQITRREFGWMST